ncbi:unnamed protein product [Polarella glacialis]|uniref:Uncharacterized protein n=1 Tax=Polarella glacialis TaxID=89957 RepID=A0A813J4N5_POLGL|nr:unnamed protein product [Polarella glacialis]
MKQAPATQANCEGCESTDVSGEASGGQRVRARSRVNGLYRATKAASCAQNLAGSCGPNTASSKVLCSGCAVNVAEQNAESSVSSAAEQHVENLRRFLFFSNAML